MPREIIVDWTTANGAGKVSVMYFLEAGTVADQRSLLSTFLAGVDGFLDSSVTWSIRTEGREMNDVTGALEGAWSESTAHAGVGTTDVEPVADSTQVLVRWLTGQIEGGRFLQGRTFIPGLGVANIAGGNLATAARTGLQTLADAFVGAANTTFGVWKRPVLQAGGKFLLAPSALVNSELAVLRRRRD